MTLYIILHPTIDYSIFTEQVEGYVYKQIVHEIPNGNITFSDNDHCYRHVCAALYLPVDLFNKSMSDDSTKKELHIQLMRYAVSLDYFILIIDGDLYKEYNPHLSTLHKWQIESRNLKMIVIPSDSDKNLHILEITILNLFTQYKKQYSYFYDTITKLPRG